MSRLVFARMSAELPFEGGEDVARVPKTEAPRAVRFKRAEREQVCIELLSVDNALPQDHEARSVLDYVNELTLTAFYAGLGTVEGRAGRNPNDPRAMVALWLYATVDGVGSARHLAELCEVHLAYRFLAGGLSVGYGTLASFRRNWATELDALLTDGVARLMKAGAVKLDAIAVDGCKIQARASAASFRSKPTLERFKEEAAARVKTLKEELENDPSAGRDRLKQRDLRAAERRKKQVEEALKKAPPAEQKKRKTKKPEEIRSSMTDPDARKMRMGDGGYRPAYNVQFATDVDSGVIVATKVTNQGNDGGLLPAVLEQCAERYDQTPKEVLADGSYATKEHVAYVQKRGIALIGPVLKDRPRDDAKRKKKSSPEFEAWRTEMATPEKKERYKRRAPTAELPHAQLRNRGMRQFRLRGFHGAAVEVCWQVLAHNYLRHRALKRPQT